MASVQPLYRHLAPLISIAAIGCGAGAGASGAPSSSFLGGSAAVASRRALEASHAPAQSHRIATISRNAIGPFVARAGDAGLAAWIVGTQRGDNQDLMVVALAGDGAPLTDPHAVASVPRETTSLAVRAAGGAHAGWVLAYSALLDRGESLTVLGLGADSTPKNAPIELARTSDHIKWADIVPTSRGAVVVWAEETSTGDANLLAAPVDGEAKPLGVPVRVARSIDRWQAIAMDDGVGLALVAAGRKGDDPLAAGRLSWMRLDALGHPRAEAVSIGAKATVSGDLDAVVSGGSALLAWTDRTGEDARIMLAAVDPSGKVTGPTPVMRSVGGAALVALASGPRGAALAWQEPSATARTARSLHLSLVTTSPALSAQTMTSVDNVVDRPPELVATDSGFAILVSAPACLASGGQGRCQGPVAPTFVRFDARLDPVQTEPIVLGEGTAAAALGWGLRCAADRCLALAATNEAPTPIVSFNLEPRSSPFAAPTTPHPPADAPRMMSIATVASGQAYEDVAAAPLGDATVIAALAGGADVIGNLQRGAFLTLRTVDADGRVRVAASTLSSRAVPTGGVAVAPAGAIEDGAAVAWVGWGDHDRQVHVTHLDRTGRRNNEVQLTTRAKGDVSSVAIAWADNGWIVAWVDARDGNGEVYATKIDRDLSRVAREERITNAPGDAADIALAVRGNAAWLAWSDPRESPGEGLADIYATTLRTLDAKRAGDEVRVLATAPHSRSPQLAPTPNGENVILTWIEDASTGLEGPGAAMVSVLDRNAHVIRAPATFTLAASGLPTSIALAPARQGVRAIVTRSNQGSITLDALTLGPNGVPSKAWPLLDLDAASSFDVALALVGDTLIFDDAGPGTGDHQVRRATIAWGR